MSAKGTRDAPRRRGAAPAPFRPAPPRDAEAGIPAVPRQRTRPVPGGASLPADGEAGAAVVPRRRIRSAPGEAFRGEAETGAARMARPQRKTGGAPQRKARPAPRDPFLPRETFPREAASGPGGTAGPEERGGAPRRPARGFAAKTLRGRGGPAPIPDRKSVV